MPSKKKKKKRRRRRKKKKKKKKKKTKKKKKNFRRVKRKFVWSVAVEPTTRNFDCVSKSCWQPIKLYTTCGN